MIKKIAVLKAGETLPSLADKRGDFEDWIIEGMGIDPSSSQVTSIFQGEKPPNIDQISGVVITGSHQPVMEKMDWSENTTPWLKRAVEGGIPILGICFGHQLLAYALGSRIADTPGGPEFGTVEIKLTKAANVDPLFEDLPGVIEVQSSHYQAVIDLPRNAARLGSSPIDPHAAFRVGSCAWGVQFHPEFDAEITRAYIHHYRQRIENANGDFNYLLQNCRNTPEGGKILSRFAEFCWQ
jgi:GMP synthase (glutamine-hydrolysing)